MKIIGLIGKKESGKSTFAKFIQGHCPKDKKCVILSFASILKTMLFKAEICTEEEMYLRKTPYSREMMQKIGTNIIRDQIDPNFFCKCMIKEIKEVAKSNPPFNKDTIIVIDDVRFQNEAQLIENIDGVLISIIRPESEVSLDVHKSETEMDRIKTEMAVFNDSDLENLEKAAKSLMDFMPAFKNTTSTTIAMVTFD